jgi:hypothetical protein
LEERCHTFNQSNFIAAHRKPETVRRYNFLFFHIFVLKFGRFSGDVLYRIGPESGNRFSEKSDAKTRIESTVPIPIFGTVL